MKYKIRFLTFATILLVISCGTSFGKKETFGNLEIFYSESIPVNYVTQLGNYFTLNNLILDQTHSIKLTSNHNSFVLKVIIDPKHTDLPKKMIIELSSLEADIKATIFKDLNFKIEICDVNFYPLNLKN